MNLPMNLNDIDLWEKELLKGFALPLGFLPEIGEVVNILEPFKRLTIFEPVEKDGETTEKEDCQMKVAMVKHKPYGKVFWFEIPEHFVGKLQPGFRVACNTARGRRYGTVVAADLDEQDVKEVMLASGATFPLSTIEATTQKVLMSTIKIPGYMARTKPSDEKIAKRFLEFYHTGQFNTNVALDDNAVLIDGYSAYLVAQKVGLTFLPAIYKEV